MTERLTKRIKINGLTIAAPDLLDTELDLIRPGFRYVLYDDGENEYAPELKLFIKENGNNFEHLGLIVEVLAIYDTYQPGKRLIDVQNKYIEIRPIIVASDKLEDWFELSN